MAIDFVSVTDLTDKQDNKVDEKDELLEEDEEDEEEMDSNIAQIIDDAININDGKLILYVKVCGWYVCIEIYR